MFSRVERELARVAEILVELDGRFFICGNCVFREDSGHRADGLASRAVDAFFRVDEVLILTFIDAIHGTNIHTGGIFKVDAG
jgi:hypothetical protein